MFVRNYGSAYLVGIYSRLLDVICVDFGLGIAQHEDLPAGTCDLA